MKKYVTRTIANTLVFMYLNMYMYNKAKVLMIEFDVVRATFISCVLLLMYLTCSIFATILMSRYSKHRGIAKVLETIVQFSLIASVIFVYAKLLENIGFEDVPENVALFELLIIGVIIGIIAKSVTIILNKYIRGETFLEKKEDQINSKQI